MNISAVLYQTIRTCRCHRRRHDVSTPEGAQRAREDGLFTDFCPKMVASAVDILEEIIIEMENEGIAKH